MNNIEEFIKVSEKKVFLAVNKAYFGLGLKAVDLLILSSIEEYTSKDRECYLTNEQFAWITGESISTVKRVLDRLEKELNIIKRKTFTLNNNGQKSKQRKIMLNDRKLWKIESEVQNEPTLDDESKVQNENKQGSNNEKGRIKNKKSKVQNEPIKPNLKENKKSNLKENKKSNLKDKSDADAKRDFLLEELEGLDKITLQRIRDDYKSNKFGKIVITYKQIKEKYNLKNNVSQNMIDEIERILNRLHQEEWAERELDKIIGYSEKENTEPVKTEEELEAEQRIREREYQARIERARKEQEEKELERKKNKWAIKNKYQDSIFHSFILGDKEIMDSIREVYLENGNEITTDDVLCDDRFCGISIDTIFEYVKDVLDKEFIENKAI